MSTRAKRARKPWATIRQFGGGFVLRFGDAVIPEVLSADELAEQVRIYAAGDRATPTPEEET